MRLNELDLLSLQTQFMRSDTTTQGFCNALNAPMINIVSGVEKCLIWRNYGNLSEEVLDAMAVSLNILWYDSEADYEIKAFIIEKADELRLLQGTAKGIELMFQAWNVTIYILEWFNYGGEPFHYKIVVDYSYYDRLYDVAGDAVYDKDGFSIYTLLDVPFLPDGALLTKLTNLLPFVQPARCVLDGVTAVDGAIQNTVADVNSLGVLNNIISRFVWDLKYQI